MKKRIVLIVLLVAVAAGMAFTEKGYNGRDIPFTAYPTGVSGNWVNEDVAKVYGIDGIKILSVKQTLVGIDVTYSTTAKNKDVYFRFKAEYSDGTAPKTWEDVEHIRGARSSSTWRFSVLNCYHISNVTVTWY